MSMHKKERLNYLGLKIRRSKIKCNSKRLIPLAEHKDPYKIRCAYAGRPVWRGHDFDVSYEDYHWSMDNGDRVIFPKAPGAQE